MSFFYLSAVKGNMPMHLIETIVFNRLEFLSSVSKGNITGYNEYMVEGSIYDNVGHFMLCVLCILYQNRTFTQFLCKSETELFGRRMQTLSTYDLRCFAKKIIRNIKKYKVYNIYTETLETLCQNFMLKLQAQHINSPHHNQYCKIHNFIVNFKACLFLVSKRKVELIKGKAIVPCGQWKQFFITLFEETLRNKLNKTDIKTLDMDPRILELVTKLISNKFPLHIKQDKNVLTSMNVDAHIKNFPLCMKNLHLQLRHKHRLSHDQRFYYSLFLKDIGMPLDEAVEFWRAEYRQAPKGHSTCNHSWERDEKKYLYGIRHMYGLEGARKKYTSVSCCRIQSTMNASSEGGCPFKSFDNINLRKLFDSQFNYSKDSMSQLNRLLDKNKYTSACMLYNNVIFKKSSDTNCDNMSYNFSPVIYYGIAFNNGF